MNSDKKKGEFISTLTVILWLFINIMMWSLTYQSWKKIENTYVKK